MSMALVVGSDGRIKSDTVKSLEEMGFGVVSVPSDRQIPEHWDEDHASLIVVVSEGPRSEHVDLCRRMRSRARVPLVVVGNGDEEAVVDLLEAGADEYVSWPTKPRLMAAKIEALLRSSRRSSARHIVAKHGELMLNFVRRQVIVGCNEASLTPIEFRLLSCLLQNAGRVVSSRTLVKEVQGFDCDEREAQETIKVYVRRLRHKIEPDPRQPVYVLNVRGFGYVLETRPKRTNGMPARVGHPKSGAFLNDRVSSNLGMS